VPTCAAGAVRGLMKGVVLATDFKGRNAIDVDCTSTKAEAAMVDDVDAFANGYATLTVVPLG
jgi:hypothetical protein